MTAHVPAVVMLVTASGARLSSRQAQLKYVTDRCGVGADWSRFPMAPLGGCARRLRSGRPADADRSRPNVAEPAGVSLRSERHHPTAARRRVLLWQRHRILETTPATGGGAPRGPGR